jgi:hypothetical protein
MTMTPSPKDTEPALDGQVAPTTFRDFVQEQMRQATRVTFEILDKGTSQVDRQPAAYLKGNCCLREQQ